MGMRRMIGATRIRGMENPGTTTTLACSSFVRGSSGVRADVSRRSSGHLSGSLSGHRCGLRTRLVVIVVDCGRCLRLFDVRCLRLFDAPATPLQNFVLCFMCRSSALL